MNFQHIPVVKEDFDLRQYSKMHQSANYLDDTEFIFKSEKMDKSSKNRSKSHH